MLQEFSEKIKGVILNILRTLIFGMLHLQLNIRRI